MNYLLRGRYLKHMDRDRPLMLIDAMQGRGAAVPAYMSLLEDIGKRGGYNVSEGLTPINELRRTPLMLSYGLRNPEALGRILPSGQGIDLPEWAGLSPLEQLGLLATRESADLRRWVPWELDMAAVSPEKTRALAEGIHRRAGNQNVFDPRSGVGESSLRRGLIYDLLREDKPVPPELSEGAFYARGGLASLT
jgi:hypothetical protein